MRLVAVPLIVVAVSLITAPQALAKRSCGIVHPQEGVSAKVTVEKGDVRCAKARDLITKALSGRKYPLPKGQHQGAVIDGYYCYVHTGLASCERPRKPKNRVYGDYYFCDRNPSYEGCDPATDEAQRVSVSTGTEMCTAFRKRIVRH